MQKTKKYEKTSEIFRLQEVIPIFGKKIPGNKTTRACHKIELREHPGESEMKEQNIKVQKGEKNWNVTLKFQEGNEESEQIRSEIVEVLSGTLLEECR